MVPGVNKLVKTTGDAVVKDISKATNQQLYHIALDRTERLKDRYEAARELQKRKEKCSMANPVCPKCQTEGQVVGKFQRTIVLECPSLHRWKQDSEVCPSCEKPNGFANEGLCLSCYGEGR